MITQFLFHGLPKTKLTLDFITKMRALDCYLPIIKCNMDSRSEQKNKNNLETIRQHIMNIGT